jgi:hypothetical protein
MLRTSHKIITGLMIALGLLHVSVTFVDYDTFSMNALWFASAGVAIIPAGFLNVGKHYECRYRVSSPPAEYRIKK